MKTAEETRAYMAAWRAKNKERLTAHRAQPEVRAKYRAYWVANYACHRDEIRLERKGYSAVYRSKNPWKGLLHAAKRRADKSGIAFALTDDWAKSRYTGFCELTGLPFVISGGKRPGPKMGSPSIDRVDQSIGYEPNNCRFILNCVNVFRGQMSDVEMLKVAHALVERATPPTLSGGAPYAGSIHQPDPANFIGATP